MNNGYVCAVCCKKREYRESPCTIYAFFAGLEINFNTYHPRGGVRFQRAKIRVNPFVDWVLDTLFNPTEHYGETQAKEISPPDLGVKSTNELKISVTFIFHLMKKIESFYDFSNLQLGAPCGDLGACVETCLQAMHDGVLDVCVQNKNGNHVWELFSWEMKWTLKQWQRLCGLLQRAGITNGIVWDSVFFLNVEFCAEIEYLWTDLEPVQMFLKRNGNKPRAIVQELERRQAWAVSPRRAWLAACVHGACFNSFLTVI